MISFSINLQLYVDYFLAGVFFLPAAFVAFFVGVFFGLAAAFFFGDAFAFLGDAAELAATSCDVSSFTGSKDLTGDFLGDAFFAAVFFAAGFLPLAAAFFAGAFFAAAFFGDGDLAGEAMATFSDFTGDFGGDGDRDFEGDAFFAPFFACPLVWADFFAAGFEAFFAGDFDRFGDGEAFRGLLAALAAPDAEAERLVAFEAGFFAGDLLRAGLLAAGALRAARPRSALGGFAVASPAPAFAAAFSWDFDLAVFAMSVYDKCQR